MRPSCIESRACFFMVHCRAESGLDVAGSAPATDEEQLACALEPDEVVTTLEAEPKDEGFVDANGCFLMASMIDTFAEWAFVSAEDRAFLTVVVKSAAVSLVV